MGKKFIALLLVITFLGMNCAIYEQSEGLKVVLGQKPGTRLAVQQKNGHQVTGELIAVKGNSLLLKEENSGADVNLNISDVKFLNNLGNSNSSKAKRGALYGALIGGVCGAVLGYKIVEEYDGEESDKMGGALLVGFLGVCIGSAIGYLTGAILENRNETIQIAGKSNSEINKILDDLRKKARVPDFQ